MSVNTIIIHGGIKEFEGGDASPQGYRDALKDIAQDAYSVLIKQGARAAVLRAVRRLEDDPLFNAGTGSRIQADGEIRMSAALVDGNRQKFSGVINIQYVKNPIDIAAQLASEKNTVLAGPDATRFARGAGYQSYHPYTEHRAKEFAKRRHAKTGTVGAIALDEQGSVFAATSTGGVGGEAPGRVSDSATVAGTYATDKVGVCLTGVGEEIVNHAAAARIAVRVEDGRALQQAVEKTISEARSHNYLYGLIALDNSGQIVVDQTQGSTLWASSNGRETITF